MLVLVALTAAGFVLQGIALLLIATRIKATTTRTQKVLSDLERRGNQLMLQANVLLESLKPLAGVAKSVGANVTEIVEIARRRTGELDALVQEIMETVKVQTNKLDYVVTDTVQKFEQTTASIQRDVLVPTMEIASLIKGIRTGFDFFFSKKKDRSEVGAQAQDEEMFI
jgi:ABC-type transporter Mla subunit MlaD